MKHLKKLLFCIVVVMFMLMLMALPAFADNASAPDTNYMSWEFFGTMGGATAAVLLIVQFLKAPLDRLWKLPTRFVAYLFALIILILVALLTEGFLLADILLIPFNAIIVTVAAMGTYEATFNRNKAVT